jgi:hypothetical protein
MGETQRVGFFVLPNGTARVLNEWQGHPDVFEGLSDRVHNKRTVNKIEINRYRWIPFTRQHKMKPDSVLADYKRNFPDIPITVYNANWTREIRWSMGNLGRERMAKIYDEKEKAYKKSR